VERWAGGWGERKRDARSGCFYRGASQKELAAGMTGPEWARAEKGPSGPKKI